MFTENDVLEKVLAHLDLALKHTETAHGEFDYADMTTAEVRDIESAMKSLRQVISVLEMKLGY